MMLLYICRDQGHLTGIAGFGEIDGYLSSDASR